MKISKKCVERILREEVFYGKVKIEGYTVRSGHVKAHLYVDDYRVYVELLVSEKGWRLLNYQIEDSVYS